MKQVWVKGRESTVAWQGDLIVLGAGLAGVQSALTAARLGFRTCLIEPGPTLGTEVSGMWLNELPASPLTSELFALCRRRKAIRGKRIDILTATLALDRIVEKAKITAIVRALPMRPVSDTGGRLFGVEIVGKSGRQLLKAPRVVDATPGRRFSRRVLGLTPLPVLSVERRCYLYGIAAVPDEMELTMPGRFGLERNSLRIIPAAWPREVLLSFSIQTGSGAEGWRGGDTLSPEWQTLALNSTLQKAIGLMQYLKVSEPMFCKASLVDLSPQLKKTFDDDGMDASRLTSAGLHPVPFRQDLTDDIRMAVFAVKQALDQTRHVVMPVSRPTGSLLKIKTSELAAAPEWDLKSCRLPDAVAVRHEPTDVVVAGCGPGGSFAALAAAGQEVKVTALDNTSFIGGIGSSGWISGYYYGISGGLQDAIDQSAKRKEHNLGKSGMGWYPVAKALVLTERMQQLGVQVAFGHMVFGAVMKGRRVIGVLSADENGYHYYPCRVAVDGTGDGDLAAAAGAPFSLGRAGDGFLQPYSYTPSLLRKGKISYHNFDVGWADPTDTLDYSRAHFEGRRDIWMRGPFSAKAHYFTLASMLGIRESRLIQGRTRLTLEDFIGGRRFADTVGTAKAHYDNHAFDYAEESEWARRYVALLGLWAQLLQGELSYQALLPKSVEGLLVGSRALSVDHDLHMLFRMQRDIQTVGTACGMASALAVKSRILPSRLRVVRLRKHLRDIGVCLKAESPPLMSVSAGKLMALLGTKQNGMALWRLVKLGGKARSEWTSFFETERDSMKRFYGAIAVTLAGLKMESARAELYRVMMKERLEEPHVGIRSPPLYIVAALVLAQTGSPGIANVIGDMLNTMKLEVPSIVLLLSALGKTGDKAGIRYIRAFLRRMTRQADASQERTWCINRISFRFNLEMRAVKSLQMLGYRMENRRLKPYLHHPNLLIRRHARRLMSG